MSTQLYAKNRRTQYATVRKCTRFWWKRGISCKLASDWWEISGRSSRQPIVSSLLSQFRSVTFWQAPFLFSRVPSYCFDLAGKYIFYNPWWWWCYQTSSEGWGRGRTPRRSNSRTTTQDLDQTLQMEETVPKIARRRGSDAGQSRRR